MAILTTMFTNIHQAANRGLTQLIKMAAIFSLKANQKNATVHSVLSPPCAKKDRTKSDINSQGITTTVPNRLSNFGRLPRLPCFI
jgi:hypothetical protein